MSPWSFGANTTGELMTSGKNKSLCLVNAVSANSTFTTEQVTILKSIHFIVPLGVPDTKTVGCTLSVRPQNATMTHYLFQDNYLIGPTYNIPTRIKNFYIVLPKNCLITVGLTNDSGTNLLAELVYEEIDDNQSFVILEKQEAECKKPCGFFDFLSGGCDVR